MFNPENITRRSNLELDDSLSAYQGHAAQQNPWAYETFYNFLEKIKPDRILEIGTASGGFTLFLKLCCNDLDLKTEILSYEIYDRPSYDELKKLGIDVRIENIFEGNYNSVSSEPINFIQQEGITVVLCDGGWKTGEFNLLSKHIKIGDYILAHDYASNKEVFENEINKIFWNWHEIQDSDIENAVKENNLHPFMENEFKKAVWVCKVKH